MFVDVFALDNKIGIEAGFEGMGTTNHINAFFGIVILIFDEGIGLSNFLVADSSLGIHVGA